MSKRDTKKTNPKRSGTVEESERLLDEQAIGDRDQRAALDPDASLNTDTTEDVAGGRLADATGGLPANTDGNRVRKAPSVGGPIAGVPGGSGDPDASSGDPGADTDITANIEETRNAVPRGQEGGLAGGGAGVANLRNDLGSGNAPSTTQASGSKNPLGETPGGMGGAGDAATTGSPAGSTGGGVGGVARALGGAADRDITEDRSAPHRDSGPRGPGDDVAEGEDANTLREFLSDVHIPGTRRVVDITDDITPGPVDVDERKRERRET